MCQCLGNLQERVEAGEAGVKETGTSAGTSTSTDQRDLERPALPKGSERQRIAWEEGARWQSPGPKRQRGSDA